MSNDGHSSNEEQRQKLRQRVEEALKSSETLAPITGLLDSSASGRELRTCRLWGKLVVVVADCMAQGHIPLRAGDKGIIGWQYPVTGSIFNLQSEAPVEGLSAAPHACIGVPWDKLSLAGFDKITNE